MSSTKTRDICGEEDPGFTLWTSAHGFHHYTLSRNKGWRCLWALILFILVVSLICCVIYYFYYVFSTAVYSRIIIESPSQRAWPTTIVCEKQVFTFSKLIKIPSLNVAHASLLSWTLDPELSRPDVYSSNAQIPILEESIENLLQSGEYNNDYNKLLFDLAPNCTEFILECKVGNALYNGTDCCGRIFDQKPHLTRYGTCFTTKTGSYQHSVTLAGEGSGLTVVTMHDNAGAPYDRSFASSELFGASGVAFAITDGSNTVESSLRGQGQTSQPGKIASIGITRTLTDNSDLELSAIGRMKCTPPGNTDVDSDLLLGTDTQNYGYTKENCINQGKKELLSSELFGCSFNPSGSSKRCSPLQSATYFRSLIDSNSSSLDRINVVKISDKEGLQDRYDKDCQQDCLQDRYSLSASYSDLSDSLKADLQSKMTASGISGKNVIVLKFYLNSMEFTKVHNFPQHGLQFVAEVGGLMAFFLGLSSVSVLECICYCCVFTYRKCSGQDREEEERQKWKQGMNGDDMQVGDMSEARRRAELRQQRFNEMDQRLREMDAIKF